MKESDNSQIPLTFSAWPTCIKGSEEYISDEEELFCSPGLACCTTKCKHLLNNRIHIDRQSMFGVGEGTRSKCDTRQMFE